MFDYIRKEEYFAWIDAFQEYESVHASASIHNLKNIQDHFILSRLDGVRGSKLLEMGGADCRVLRSFADHNECWNADRFEGLGAGPKNVIETPGVVNVLAYLGEFSAELPDGYFDVVFSVSVIEHVETEQLRDMFRDIARILKPGGRTYHAIDAYLFDPGRFSESQAAYTKRRLEAYLEVPAMTDGRLQFVDAPEAGSDPGFSCEYATNADREMLAWNKAVPYLAPTRAISQSCSLKAEWVKT